MKKWIQKLKENQMLLDGINVVLGIVMIVAIVVLLKWQSVIAMFVVIWAAGLINIMNGLKMLKKKKQRIMGQSMIFMGLLIVIAGTMLALYGM